MSDNWNNYVEDPRTICKFGSKCYQKNPDHHKTYKHPPVLKNKAGKKKVNRHRFEPYRKNKQIKTEVCSKNVNDEISTSEKKPLIKNIKCDFIIENSDEMMTYNEKSDQKIFKELFLVDMPSDFYKFYDCLKSLEKPIEETLSAVNLQLIGPFDLILGRLPVLNDKELYLIHSRYFYDPPEFQTVLKGKGEYHIGYFRDNPNEDPVFLASNDSSINCQLKPLSDNIFGAVYFYLQMEKKTSPFSSVACQILIEKIKKWADDLNYCLKEFDMKARLSWTVTKTFHGAGIVVPYNKKTKLGYRPLSETDAQLKKMFSTLEKTSKEGNDHIMTEIQSVITNATLAMDECDFGTGLELGINLFCSGLKELEKVSLDNLCTAYTLLDREAFKKIIQTHLKYRRKGQDMSLLSLIKQNNPSL